MAGRKSKLTPERQQRICDALRGGNTRRVAAILGGIGASTFYDWLSWADPEHELYDPIYSDFSDAIKEAEAEAEAESVSRIRKAAFTSWQADAWYLERKNPDDWGKREKLDHTHEIKTNKVKIGDDEIEF